MLEGFKSSPSTEGPSEKWKYFSGTPSSKEFIAAKKFAEKYIETGEYPGELFDTPEHIAELHAFIESLGKKLPPGINVSEVVSELKKAGALQKPLVGKKEKPVEFIETKYITLEGTKSANLGEDQLKLLEANLLMEELERENVFKNPDELQAVYDRAIEMQLGRIESEEYYYEFSDAGLIKGGREEVAADLRSLAEVKKAFEAKDTKTKEEKERLEEAKKIATITESALAHGVTKHLWYGENVSIEQVSEFDDVKRGVDSVLEIRKEDDESNFMALGIDVTFRGLHSEQFKQKFFRLLSSIRDGHKTKIKYFKNHKQEPMKEFPVPKMVLYFSVGDVKDMVDILKDKDLDQKEGQQKINVLNQIVRSCSILADFAEESQNNIFRRYVAVINSLKEQGWENPHIQEILDNADEESEVTKHLEELVEEFKLLESTKSNEA
jgi:hypothetical protein